jgi:hypothetical protein
MLSWYFSHIYYYYYYYYYLLFIFKVYIGPKFCLSRLETGGFRFPSGYVRDFALFSVCSSSKNCPSARRGSVLVLLYRDVDVFGAKAAFVNRILWWFLLIIKILILLKMNVCIGIYIFIAS